LSIVFPLIFPNKNTQSTNYKPKLYWDKGQKGLLDGWLEGWMKRKLAGHPSILPSFHPINLFAILLFQKLSPGD
jgi:hypothetical protein